MCAQYVSFFGSLIVFWGWERYNVSVRVHSAAAGYSSQLSCGSPAGVMRIQSSEQDSWLSSHSHSGSASFWLTKPLWRRLLNQTDNVKKQQLETVARNVHILLTTPVWVCAFVSPQFESIQMKLKAFPFLQVGSTARACSQLYPYKTHIQPNTGHQPLSCVYKNRQTR